MGGASEKDSRLDYLQAELLKLHTELVFVKRLLILAITVGGGSEVLTNI